MKRSVCGLLLAAALFTACGREDESVPVRGVWIPDPSFTEFLHSPRNILRNVAELDEVGINTLFVCAYARDALIFRSDVYRRNVPPEHAFECYMLTPWLGNFRSGGVADDPLRVLIDAAHERGMRVILWFEYGFMASHGPTPADHPLLAVHPEWRSAGSDGSQANYNGTDYYLNGYHPGFQAFMLDLIAEALDRYPDVDGIQCDDRMPAMPRDSGYDDATRGEYLAQTGQLPPDDCNERAWVRWRLDRLNDFARRLHDLLRERGDYMVCFSPNPWPWCEENLMQEYPAWVESGVVDLLSVQCYRFDAVAYAATLETVLKSLGGQIGLLNPGMILKVGERTILPETLDRELKLNRRAGIEGESYFYNEGLRDPEIQKIVRRHYGTER